MTWLTVKKIAALCDIDQSTVKKAVKAGRCQSRYVEGIGRGGRQLEIAVETIPWEITENDTKQTAFPDILQFTGRQREGADFRALVVTEYQRSGLSPEYGRTGICFDLQCGKPAGGRNHHKQAVPLAAAVQARRDRRPGRSARRAQPGPGHHTRGSLGYVLFTLYDPAETENQTLLRYHEVRIS